MTARQARDARVQVGSKLMVRIAGVKGAHLARVSEVSARGPGLRILDEPRWAEWTRHVALRPGGYQIIAVLPSGRRLRS